MFLVLLLLLAKRRRHFGEPYSPHNKYEPHVAPGKRQRQTLPGSYRINGQDCSIQSARQTPVDKTNKQAAFIDIAVPLPHKLQAAITEKQRKYQNLTFEIKQQWKNTQNFFIPQPCLLRGSSRNMLSQRFATLILPPRLLYEVQKVVVLNPCSMVRKFLNDEVYLPDEEADIP